MRLLLYLRVPSLLNLRRFQMGYDLQVENFSVVDVSVVSKNNKKLPNPVPVYGPRKLSVNPRRYVAGVSDKTRTDVSFEVHTGWMSYDFLDAVSNSSAVQRDDMYTVSLWSEEDGKDSFGIKIRMLSKDSIGEVRAGILTFYSCSFTGFDMSDPQYKKGITNVYHFKAHHSTTSEYGVLLKEYGLSDGPARYVSLKGQTESGSREYSIGAGDHLVTFRKYLDGTTKVLFKDKVGKLLSEDVMSSASADNLKKLLEFK